MGGSWNCGSCTWTQQYNRRSPCLPPQHLKIDQKIVERLAPATYAYFEVWVSWRLLIFNLCYETNK